MVYKNNGILSWKLYKHIGMRTITHIIMYYALAQSQVIASTIRITNHRFKYNS